MVGIYKFFLYLFKIRTAKVSKEKVPAKGYLERFLYSKTLEINEFKRKSDPATKA
jgi:hypothetical protein